MSQGGKAEEGGGDCCGMRALQQFLYTVALQNFKDLLRLQASSAGSESYTHEKCGFLGVQSK